MRPLLLIIFEALAANAAYSALFGDYWNITEWQWQTALAVDKWLYVDGGELYNQADLSQPDVTFYSLSSTLIINLSTSWTNATAKGWWWNRAASQNVRRPNLWYDPFDKRVYRWGGWPYFANYTDESKLWHFNYQASGDVDWILDTPPTASGLKAGSAAPWGPGIASSPTTFYSLGGVDWTTNTAIQGLVEYNFASGTWINQTSIGATGSGYYAQGQGAYAPNFGTPGAGFLFFVGGEIPSNQTYEYESGNDLADMSIIRLYNIATGNWYLQEATGEIPLPRTEFCSVSKANVENTGFEIFIYGGMTNETWDTRNQADENFLNVYTLSIPAFRWFKAPGSTPVRRAGHTCVVIGERQMLSIGGRQPSSIDQFGAAPDPWTNGLGVFDMTAFEWAEFYDSEAAAYKQPQAIQDYYCSNYTTPIWSNSDLATVFQFDAPACHTSVTLGPATSHNSHIGAIAGSIFGGVCALALLVLAIYLRKRRGHRRLTQQETDQMLEKEFAGDQGPHEADGKGKYAEVEGTSRAELASPFPELHDQKRQLKIKRKPVGAAMIHELPGSPKASMQGGCSES